MYEQQTFTDLLSAISSRESADGRSPCALPVGQMIDPSGPEAARASRLAALESDWLRLTKDTCGHSSETSSLSVALQESLANRLRQRLHCDGSMEFALIWKERATPSGLRICALRASARRISGKDFTGLRSPTTGDSRRGVELNPRERNPKAGTASLNNEVALAPWPTPNTMEGGQTSRGGKRKGELLMGGLVGWRTPDSNQRGGAITDPDKVLSQIEAGHQTNLEDQATLAGWPTPNLPTGGPNSKRQERGAGGMDLEEAVTLAGWPSPIATESRQGFQDRTHGKKGTQKSLTTVAVESCPIISSQQPAASSQQPAASSQQPAASSQQPAASSQQPAARRLARLVYAQQQGLEGHARNEHDRNESRWIIEAADRPTSETGATCFWSPYELIDCLDGKARRIEPGTFPLANGVPARVVRLRGYGNAIVPQTAAEFVEACEECLK